MSVRAVPAADAIARLDEFDAVIDARSENEYAEDHLPRAINWPSLDNAQRHEVGTLYKQVNPFEARKRGAALVATNIARHIEREAASFRNAIQFRDTDFGHRATVAFWDSAPGCRADLPGIGVRPLSNRHKARCPRLQMTGRFD